MNEAAGLIYCIIVRLLDARWDAARPRIAEQRIFDDAHAFAIPDNRYECDRRLMHQEGDA